MVDLLTRSVEEQQTTKDHESTRGGSQADMEDSEERGNDHDASGHADAVNRR